LFKKKKVKLKKYKTNSLKIGSDLWLKNLGLNTINLAKVEKRASPGHLQGTCRMDGVSIRNVFFVELLSHSMLKLLNHV
jgi:hypothetical protein